jgi:hypothetical protein
MIELLDVSPGFIKALIKTTTRKRTKENKQRERTTNIG